jgi:hypothetical protein
MVGGAAHGGGRRLRGRAARRVRGRGPLSNRQSVQGVSRPRPGGGRCEGNAGIHVATGIIWAPASGPPLGGRRFLFAPPRRRRRQPLRRMDGGADLRCRGVRRGLDVATRVGSHVNYVCQKGFTAPCRTPARGRSPAAVRQPGVPTLPASGRTRGSCRERHCRRRRASRFGSSAGTTRATTVPRSETATSPPARTRSSQGSRGRGPDRGPGLQTSGGRASRTCAPTGAASPRYLRFPAGDPERRPGATWLLGPRTQGRLLARS